MTAVARFVRFNLVGGLGLGVQLGTVAVLVHELGVDPVVATAAAVSVAIVHNFIWHVRWTWRDRMRPGTARLHVFFRFVGANGVVSLVGSVLLMPILLGAARLSPIPASLATVAVCGLLNFWLADAGYTAVTWRPSAPNARRSAHAKETRCSSNPTAGHF